MTRARSSLNAIRLLTLMLVGGALAALPLQAQFAGTSPTGPLQNLSQLTPPAGSKVAILVFEDLGCPGCAHAHPVEEQVATLYHVPLVRFDFPLEAHVWTFGAAVDARYIQKKISPQLANQFRRDVFAAQNSISAPEDIQQFFRTWLQRHGQQAPFVVDPDGSLTREVRADLDLGRRIHLGYTPTIVVVSPTRQQVVAGSGQTGYDVSQLSSITAAALAQTPAAVDSFTPSARTRGK